MAVTMTVTAQVLDVGAVAVPVTVSMTAQVLDPLDAVVVAVVDAVTVPVVTPALDLPGVVTMSVTVVDLAFDLPVAVPVTRPVLLVTHGHTSRARDMSRETLYVRHSVLPALWSQHARVRPLDVRYNR